MLFVKFYRDIAFFAAPSKESSGRGPRRNGGSRRRGCLRRVLRGLLEHGVLGFLGWPQVALRLHLFYLAVLGSCFHGLGLLCLEDAAGV